jgi:pectin methylesterase-like acyl-CoA thioesterase
MAASIAQSFLRRLAPVLGLASILALAAPAAAAPHVLLVGSYEGKPGTYSTIQEAVDAAKPNDWILVGPGDYK